MVSWENTPVLSVCDYGLSRVAMACLLGVKACPSPFPSCQEANDLNTNSGWDVDPDKPVWSTSSREDITDPCFCILFVIFVPDSMTCNQSKSHSVSYWVSSSGTPPQRWISLT